MEGDWQQQTLVRGGEVELADDALARQPLDQLLRIGKVDDRDLTRDFG